MTEPARSSPPIDSPCVGICQFDHALQVCSGCGRTLEQIGQWARYTDAQRAELMDALADWRARHGAALSQEGS